MRTAASMPVYSPAGRERYESAVEGEDEDSGDTDNDHVSILVNEFCDTVMVL